MQWKPTVAVVCLMMAAIGVGADEDHESGRFDWSDDGFEYEISYESESNGTETEEEFEVEWDAEDAELTIQMESEQETEDRETEQEESLDIEFYFLVEYNDTDGDGAFVPGNDTAYGFWAIGDDRCDDDCDDEDGEEAQSTSPYGDYRGAMNWRSINPGSDYSTHTDENGTMHRVEVRADFGPQDAPSVFGFNFKIYEYNAEADGSNVARTQVKFDIVMELDGSAYAHEGSQMSVVHVVESEFELEDEFDDDVEEGTPADEEDSVASGAGGRMEYRWRNNATVDDRDTPVGSHVSETETESSDDEDADEEEQTRLITFSYERGSSILHDPIAGSRGAPSLLEQALDLLAALL